MKKYSLYGVIFEKMDRREALRRLKKALALKKTTVVFTPNTQILGLTLGNERLKRLLNSADILLPDGMGLGLICRKKGIGGVDRITGIDTAHSLLGHAESRGYRVFLLGGEHGVAELAAERLRAQFPALCICGTHHGYFDKKKDSPQNIELIGILNKAKPDILFVCFGFPTQEAWIVQNAKGLPSVSLFMGLGGSLDVWSGRVKRAPILFRTLRLEWLWRCARQPKRILSLLYCCGRLIARVDKK